MKYEAPLEWIPKPRTKKFTNDDVQFIRKLFRSGMSITKLAEQYECSRPCIVAALKGVGAYRGV